MATSIQVRSQTPSEIVTQPQAACDSTQTLLSNRTNLSEVDSLVEAAICDGRFLAVLQDHPCQVAEVLECRISGDGAHELSVTPLRDLLDHLYRAKFGERKSNDQNKLAFPEAVVPFIAVGIVVVSIAIVLIVVVTWTITRDRRGKANDKSANRDLKL